MLEVVFNDSEKGAMKLAKVYNKDKMKNSAVSVAYIGEKPSMEEIKRLLNRDEGEGLGGSSGDVVCVGFALDIGSLSGAVDGAERKMVFERIWGFEDAEKNRFFNDQRSDTNKLMCAAQSETTIRIWKSNAPYSVCGFYFVCDMLREIDCEMSVVSLPEYICESDKELAVYNGWGEIDPGKFYSFLPLEKKLTHGEKIMFSDRWRELKKENAELRAVVNGRLMSVSEDFYDSVIIKNIPDEEFVMGKLIGELLGKYKLGISDNWYALRIDKMIKDNILVVVGDKDKTHPYGRILVKR